jgi:GH24 family phage-related lysozyme (muramidase)
LTGAARKADDSVRLAIQLSIDGAAFIAAWEGFVDHCYDDSKGHCTIGVGHLVHFGATTQHDRDAWKTITHAHALALLQADAHRTGIEPISASITVTLTQPQVDALMSLCFNCGGGAVAAGHDVARAVNSKPKQWNPVEMKAWRERVSAAIMEWSHPSELERRRRSEAFLFSNGKYTRATGNTFANG